MARPLKTGWDYFPLGCWPDDTLMLIEAESSSSYGGGFTGRRGGTETASPATTKRITDSMNTTIKTIKIWR